VDARYCLIVPNDHSSSLSQHVSYLCEMLNIALFSNLAVRRRKGEEGDISSCNLNNIGIFFSLSSFEFEKMEQNMLWEALDFLVRPEYISRIDIRY
jgi:hypothetical protein